jgi:hypothetical protein
LDRQSDAQLDIFGVRHERPWKPRPSCQPELFTTEHEARASAEEWEEVLARFRRLGRSDDEPPAGGRY